TFMHGHREVVEHLFPDIRRHVADPLMSTTYGLEYNHAIATLALCEDFLLTHDADVGHAARRAVAVALQVRIMPAWGYAHVLSNTSLTGWMCWAVATARESGIKPDASALSNAAKWVAT